MRRSIAIAVALVLMLVGLLGFATEAFVAIGCVILVLGSLLLAIALGMGANVDEEQSKSD
ncbi:MAG TPA: hypothetical protein VJ204_10570 [Solirubrobacterales bacterium]|jgi:hypothetical protein|nr:hypothetical protein [Solirubrobacterales bacterium]